MSRVVKFSNLHMYSKLHNSLLSFMINKETLSNNSKSFNAYGVLISMSILLFKFINLEASKHFSHFHINEHI